jgi:2-methylcitrate dehydratase PrpD
MSVAIFPKRVVDKACECFIDYLSVAVGGADTYKERNMKFLLENHLAGKNHIIGYNQKVDLRTAVMINAFNAHVLELDDSHRMAMTHLGAPIFSALLGVAEIYDSTLEELFRGAIVGYEVAVRIANAVQPSHKKRGFHVSGTCCTMGCAMGIAAMLHYTKEEMTNVLSASVTSAAGLLAVISGESEQKPYNIANAAVAGVNAALYGKYFIGAVDILGDSRGFFRAESDEYHINKLFEEDYAIESIYQKLYAACRHCHAPMEAMLKIKYREQFSIDNIDSIEVKTYDLAISGHDHVNITGVSSAKQSIPFGVAVACVKGNCGMEAFSEETISDEYILNIAKKVLIVEDNELTVLVPEKRAAIVIVSLNNGGQYKQRVDYPKGEPENPITEDEWKEKFDSLTRHVFKENEKTKREIFNFVQNKRNKVAKQVFRWI